MPRSHSPLSLARQELDYIQQVWEITKEWEVHWNEWKTGSFKTLKTEVMENTAFQLFRKLNKLSKELKVRGRRVAAPGWGPIPIPREPTSAFSELRIFHALLCDTRIGTGRSLRPPRPRLSSSRGPCP